MPKSSLSQHKTAGRVMHEFKHGELKKGPGGKRESSPAMGGRNALR